MQIEEWRPIAGYEGSYEVSSLGSVRSIPHVVKNRYSTALRGGRVLRQTPDKRGYLLVGLSRGMKVTTVKVHRLVAAAFISAPPTIDAQVNHLDCVKAHNAVSNLEWCTRQENHRHAVDAGRLDGTISPKRGKKLTADEVRGIRAARLSGETVKSIASRFGVARETAGKILRGQIWVRV